MLNRAAHYGYTRQCVCLSVSSYIHKLQTFKNGPAFSGPLGMFPHRIVIQTFLSSRAVFLRNKYWFSSLCVRTMRPPYSHDVWCFAHAHCIDRKSKRERCACAVARCQAEYRSDGVWTLTTGAVLCCGSLKQGILVSLGLWRSDWPWRGRRAQMN